MSGAFLRRRDRTNRPLHVEHYSAAGNTFSSTMGTIAPALIQIVAL